ncbi:MAG: hypothetical protein K6T91_06355, partial [Firmicutes bacterium]|nr:hypothetical protein [Bacillota bacterium]
MKKGLVILMAIAFLFAMTSLAVAKQENPPADGKGNIVANEYDLSGKDYNEKVQGSSVRLYPGATSSVHPYGTWNSPYTLGVDGYNYN